MTAGSHFLNLYTQGFARIAVGTPECRVADPAFNAAQSVALIERAAAQHCTVIALPELGLSGYTCDDLFHQQALLDACEAALATVLAATRHLNIVAVLGMPLRVQQRLFNCAVVLEAGRVLGVTPKTYLPNYGEFYEARQFNPAPAVLDHPSTDTIGLLGQQVPFGTQLIFKAQAQPHLRLHVEICEDVWAPIPPSSFAALAGATVLLNLSASNASIGKAGYRRQLVSQQSARCLAAYAYTSAGPGESTTDLAWDGHALIAENGQLLAESSRYSDTSQLLCADIDLELLVHERMRQTSFGQSVAQHAQQLAEFREVAFAGAVAKDQPLPLQRAVARFPYVPPSGGARDERCEEVCHMQVQALVQRLRSSGIQKLVIGISGGLDSTHALLICARAMDRMGLPRSHILGYTLPGFATSTRTHDQAHRLMHAVGCTAQEIDIRPSCQQMLRDLGHPFAQGHPVYDVTFENVQAGERTSHLFRLANFHQAIVVGTGDLSELALGWCTYGVGDHMSHYNVNASVPKTLIRHLVRWAGHSDPLFQPHREVLDDILGTEISPELVPADAQTGAIQSSQATLGSYDLQDFNLYYTLRYGFKPSRIAFLAAHAWLAALPPSGPDAPGEVCFGDIKSALRVFVKRFFQGSQFKRSCVPNAPKVGSGGSLSPRGDWRAPSDSSAAMWLAELDSIPDSLHSA